MPGSKGSVRNGAAVGLLSKNSTRATCKQQKANTTADIHWVFKEEFDYRLCCPLWKMRGAASLKRKGLSFITNFASPEYFSPTVGHISDVFSLMLIQLICLVLHPWASSGPSNHHTWKESSPKTHLGSQDVGVHTIQPTSAGAGHTDSLKMPDYAILWQKTEALPRNARQAWTPSVSGILLSAYHLIFTSYLSTQFTTYPRRQNNKQ